MNKRSTLFFFLLLEATGAFIELGASSNENAQDEPHKGLREMARAFAQLRDVSERERVIYGSFLQLKEAQEEVQALKKAKLDAETYVLILRVRNRIEELERKFLVNVLPKMQRVDKWKKILKQDITIAGDLKRKPELQDFLDSVTDKDVLLHIIHELYGDFSDVAAHYVKYFVKPDKKSIEGMLVNVGIIPNERKIEAIQILIEPIKNKGLKMRSE